MLQSLKCFISTIYFYFFKKQLLYFNWRLITLQYCDVHLSHVQFFETPWTAACQASLSTTNSQSLLRLMSTESVMSSNHFMLWHSFSSCLQFFPAWGSFQWVSSSHQVAKVFELQLQHQSFQWIIRTDFLEDWLVWPPWYSKNSQECSPKLQFKSIYSSVLSFLYGPTLTSIHDHWKSHNFDYSEFGHKVMLLLFSMLSSFVIVFLPRASVF